MRFRLARATGLAVDRRIAPQTSILQLLVLALAFALLGALPAAAQETTCYGVADQGGGDGTGLDGAAEDLLTRIDPADPDPKTNEETIGTGTGTFNVEASALQPGSGVLFAVDGGRLGTLDLETGVFSPRPSPIGTGSGAIGPVGFDDVDGLTFDPASGVLYGSQRIRTEDPDVLLVIDPDSGEHVADAFGSGIDYLPITPLPDETKVDDLAIDAGGTLYAITNQGGHGDRLVTIDRETGEITDVGATGQDDIEGLTATPGGDLLGVNGKEGSLGAALWDIDPQTGEASNPRELDNAGDYESISCLMAAAPPPPPPPPEVGSITIVKDAVPDSGASFGFTGDLGGFALDEDAGSATPASRTFADLDAGHYEVAEQGVAGWKLAAISCTDPDQGTEADVGAATATIDLDAGEEVVCTFTNSRLAVLGGKVPLPATGPPGLRTLTLFGVLLIGVGYAMRSAAGSQEVSPRVLRPGLLGAAAAHRVTGLPGVPSRIRGALGEGGARTRPARRSLPLERGPPRAPPS